MNRARPGPLLTVADLLFVFAAIQSAIKPPLPGPEGFMLFGVVVLNIALANLRYDLDPPIALPGPVFAALFTVIGLGVPGGTAYLLARRRQELS